MFEDDDNMEQLDFIVKVDQVENRKSKSAVPFIRTAIRTSFSKFDHKTIKSVNFNEIKANA